MGFITEDIKGREAVQNFKLGFSTPTDPNVYPDLIYMSVWAQSVGRAQEPYKIREPIFNRWEQFLSDWRSTEAPIGMTSVF